MKLKRFKDINEKYEMDTQTGDSGIELAKAVLDEAFEKHKKDQDGLRVPPQIGDAFRKITKGDAQLEGRIKGVMIDLLKNMLKQTEALKVGGDYDPKKDDPYNPENW